MRHFFPILASLCAFVGNLAAQVPIVIAKPEAFKTLVNPNCSHCVDEAKRRASELRDSDPVLCWTRGYSDGGAIPIRFFLNPYRVISDSYGVFVYDPEAGYARGFTASYDFTFHGWRNGIMVMKHKDGTLFSCLSGVAFDGPRKGDRLTPIPTVTTTWGKWMSGYPNGVAYKMSDKYTPVEIATTENQDSVNSRGKADPRLKADELVLGVRVGNKTKAYPLSRFTSNKIHPDTVGDQKIAVFHKVGGLSTTTAFRPVASQPRKFVAPDPDAAGVSPPNPGKALPDGIEVAPKPVDFARETEWDSVGRAKSGWTLEPVDAVVCKWFAWAAENPDTTIYEEPGKPLDANKKVKEVAGTAEFLRLLPKPFGVVKAVDAKNRTITLLLDGDATAKVWPVEPDAEVKIAGWWGRLDQLQPGQRVWSWLKLDRQKNPIAVVMLADELSEFDFHGVLKEGAKPLFTDEQIDAKRTTQKATLRKRWEADGLPGTLTVHHVFSGELEVLLDHEAMRWGRSLNLGDVVFLNVDAPIKGIVKSVTAWRERTVVRLVVGELESSELKSGQRLGVKMTPPSTEVENSPYPPDLGRPRTPAERAEWFLASIYCVCPVDKNICTGKFYTLASCNPNGCGSPVFTRRDIQKGIDEGKSDKAIWDELAKDRGAWMTKPHLNP